MACRCAFSDRGRRNGVQARLLIPLILPSPPWQVADSSTNLGLPRHRRIEPRLNRAPDRGGADSPARSVDAGRAESPGVAGTGSFRRHGRWVPDRDAANSPAGWVNGTEWRVRAWRIMSISGPGQRRSSSAGAPRSTRNEAHVGARTSASGMGLLQGVSSGAVRGGGRHGNEAVGRGVVAIVVHFMVGFDSTGVSLGIADSYSPGPRLDTAVALTRPALRHGRPHPRLPVRSIKDAARGW
jgi:hypothetical protein